MFSERAILAANPSQLDQLTGKLLRFFAYFFSVRARMFPWTSAGGDSLRSDSRSRPEVPALRGAMWLQFARALLWPKRYHPCQVCGELMEISTDPQSQVRKRADTLTCADRCRRQ